MRFDWQQLSPCERQVLVRHVLLQAGGPVTPEKVCSVMQKTHQLTCYTRKDGKAVIEFVTKRGVRAGVSTAETFTEGIFKAALRARGVEVDDGFGGVLGGLRRSTALVHA